MPRAPRGSESSRRPRAEAVRRARLSGRVRPRRRRGPSTPDVTRSPRHRLRRSLPCDKKAFATAPRFRIFIIDSGWNSPAHKVLQENFGLIRDLQKDDPIYVLSREQSIEFIRHHQDRIGRDPIIAVHDLAAMERERDHRLPRLPAASRPYAHATAGAAGFAALCPFPEHASPIDRSRGGNSHRSSS